MDKETEQYMSEKLEEAVRNTHSIMENLKTAFKHRNFSQNRIAALRRIQEATDFIDMAIKQKNEANLGDHAEEYYIAMLQDIRNILWKQ